MKFLSTRGNVQPNSAEEAILQGLAADGGLFVPECFPVLPPKEALVELSYPQLFAEVLAPFFTYIAKEELAEAAERAYARFSGSPPLSLREGAATGYLELFHGPTLAFKDMALCVLPGLMQLAKRHLGRREKTLLLTATSGDTGIAALEGFAEAGGFHTIVFYPKGGVSLLQERQMRAHPRKSGTVAGILGSFDDAQRGVKALLGNPELLEDLKKSGWKAASANSINLGRLLAQTVYYVYASLHRKILPPRFCVPTGNFGNVLAAHWARRIGAPIGPLLVATNENDVLDVFFRTGTYDADRTLSQTASPSMDILVSSNLERYLHEKGGEEAVRRAMKELAEKRRFSWKEGREDFASGRAEEEEVRREIRRVWEEEQILLDPHTAVGSAVLRKREEKGIVAATASPFKFPRFVLESLGESGGDDPLKDGETLSRLTGIPLPEPLKRLADAPLVQDSVCSPEQMEDIVREVLHV